MTSNAKKGTSKENDVRKIMVAQGKDCQRTYRKVVRIKKNGKWQIFFLPNDFWGCMDLETKTLDEVGYIQVTYGSKWNEKAGEILKQKWPRFAKVQIWAWFGGRKRKKKVGEGLIKAQCYDVYDLDHKKLEFVLARTVDAQGKIMEEYLKADPSYNGSSMEGMTTSEGRAFLEKMNSKAERGVKKVHKEKIKQDSWDECKEKEIAKRDKLWKQWEKTGKIKDLHKAMEE